MGKDIKKTIIRNWITKADNDLEIAKIGLSASTNATDVICFHCQQAVEKYFKAYLVSDLQEIKNRYESDNNDISIRPAPTFSSVYPSILAKANSG